MLVLNHGGKISERTVKISKEKHIRIPAIEGVEFLVERNPLIYYQSLSALTLTRSATKPKSLSERVLIIADVIVPSEVTASPPVEALAGSSITTMPAETLAGMPILELSSGDLQLLSAATYKKLADSFDPLEETRIFAEELKTLFREKAFVLTKQDATLKNFQQEIAPRIGDYGQIIFATHGYFGDKFKPEIYEPVLLMSCFPPRADNLLRMSTVMSLNLNAQIVTLLACQTGLGRHIAGEGTMGMGRAFQYAGAKSVLMSMWSIDEKPSVLLVKRFLQELSSGKNKIDALQAARKHVRAVGYDHPFFWSAFILVGEDLPN
jgi:CHAT domain-containing protein